MKKRNQKGFTIVELVIVIAVIAILAAVLIPTFADLIDKAHKSNDDVLVRNLNMLLKADEALTDRVTVNRAIEVAEENGYDVEDLTPTLEGNLIVWDENENQFYVAEEDNITAGKDKDGNPTKAENIWLIVSDYNTAKETANTSYAAYSQYLKKAPTVTLDAVVAGIAFADEVKDVDVSYAGTEAATVSFVMNGGDLKVDNPEAVVHSYGHKTTVNVVAVKGESYHEWGTVEGNINLTKGRLVIEKGSSAHAVYIVGNIEDVSIVINTDEAVTIATDPTKLADGGEANLRARISGNSNYRIEGMTLELVNMFAGGVGTKESPFLVDTYEHWDNFRTSGLANQGKYWKVTSDLDLTFDENKHGIDVFSGFIDFDNHEVKLSSTQAANYSLFNYFVRGSTMQNLRLNTYDAGIAFYVGPQKDGAVYMEGNTTVIQNVTVEGNYSCESNNYNPFGGYVQGSVRYVDCANYANITKNAATASAFVGAVVGLNYKVEFIRCENYGNVITTNSTAQMLIANGCSSYVTVNADGSYTPTQLDNIVIKECVNYGLILGYKNSNSFNKGNCCLLTNQLYAPNQISDKLQQAIDGGKTYTQAGLGNFTDVLEKEAQLRQSHDLINMDGGYIGVYRESNSISVSEDGHFVLPTVANADTYRFTFSFWYNSYEQDSDGKALAWGRAAITYDITSADVSEFFAQFPAVEWVNMETGIGTTLENVTTNTIGEHSYRLNEDGKLVYERTGENSYFFTKQPDVSLIVYDAEGNVLEIFTYKYPV